MQNWQYKSTKEAEQAALDTPALTSTKKTEEQKTTLDIAQINLVVSDLEKMRAFYAAALALKDEPMPLSRQRDVPACRFPLATGYFVLTNLPEEATGAKVHGLQEVVFSVGDEEGVEAVFQRVKAIPGCKVLKLPHFDYDNRYKVVFEDPEGNELIFCD